MNNQNRMIVYFYMDNKHPDPSKLMMGEYNAYDDNLNKILEYN